MNSVSSESLACSLRRQLIGGESDATEQSNFSAVSWLLKIQERVKEYLLLQANWDLDGAAKVELTSSSAKSLKTILNLAEAFGLPEPSIIPTREGDLSVQWHALAMSLELTPQRDGLINIYHCDGDFDEELVVSEDSSLLFRRMNGARGRIESARRSYSASS